jgi:hypothetical protein
MEWKYGETNIKDEHEQQEGATYHKPCKYQSLLITHSINFSRRLSPNLISHPHPVSSHEKDVPLPYQDFDTTLVTSFAR